eukprot:TRINITY_DN1578_c0_g1_i3.p1 TRINITY_DN1578_c0_g1~~TRINITY_DN1578_c0_g1_i3.p1  ORF type:complete len:531 (-),score=211.85 TRINITY_DN1578_c0_g1_i3:99-1691(-)
MEIISRVFTDEFHLITIDQFLSACTKLQPGVDLRRIITSLIDRLAMFIKNPENKIDPKLTAELFTTFSEHVNKVIQSRPKMPMSDMLALQSSLVALALATDPERIDFIDGIYQFTLSILSKLPNKKLESSTCISMVKQMLLSPLSTYKDILRVLDLTNYGQILEFLDFYTRRDVAVALVKTATKYHRNLEDAEKVHFLFTDINVLLEDQDDFSDEIYDDEDFQEDLVLTCKLCNLLYSEDTDVMYSLLKVAKSHLKNGGEKRLKTTFVPLIFRAMTLTNLMDANSEKSEEERAETRVPPEKVYKYVTDCVTAISELDAYLGIKLMLQCAQNAAALGFEDIAYEFMSQTFILYEDENEVKWQYDAVVMIIASLQAMSGFSEESYETLAQQASSCATKLLRKPDQCKAICLATHLYWTMDEEGEPVFQDTKQVFKLLQKAMRVADKWVNPKVQFALFAEILNRCLYYFEQGNELVSGEFLTTLIALINTKMESNVEDSEDLEDIKAFYGNTIRFIKTKQESDEEERWGEIEL